MLHLNRTVHLPLTGVALELLATGHRWMHMRRTASSKHLLLAFIPFSTFTNKALFRCRSETVLSMKFWPNSTLTVLPFFSNANRRVPYTSNSDGCWRTTADWNQDVQAPHHAHSHQLLLIIRRYAQIMFDSPSHSLKAPLLQISHHHVASVKVMV